MIETNNITATFDKVGQGVQFMLGGPAYVVTLAFCMFVICVFRLMHRWPNHFVFLPVCIIGPASYMMMESQNSTLLNNPYLVLFVIGLGLGLASLVIYGFVMIRTGLEKKLFLTVLTGHDAIFIEKTTTTTVIQEKKDETTAT